MNKYIHTTLKGILTAIMLMAGLNVWAEDGDPTNVAKIGDTEYATLQAAIDAATDGQTISLIQDITETVANTSNANSFVIDLGEYTWTYTQTDNDFAALKQDNANSVITLKNGNMVVSGTEGFNVWARNGKVIIESGTYTINSHEDYNIYATTGYVEIYGGTFTNSDTAPYNHNASLKSLNLNVHNTLSTAANIKVYGGTFTADPSMGDDSTWGTSTFVVNGYVVKTNETTPQTTYTVEPEVEVEVNLPDEATQDQKEAATALAGNTSVSETTGLGDNGSLDVTITGVTLDANNNVTSATFEVTAKDANGNAISADGTYTFRLPISAGIAAGKWVNLKHNGTPITGNTVEADGTNRYVTVTTSSFSPFGYNVLPTDPVAQIGETKYETVAAAIADAQNGEETTIELIANVTENFEITSNKHIIFVGGSYVLTGTITNNGTLKITSGVFTTQPEAGWIASGYEVMNGADGKYIVSSTGTAEAKICVDEKETLYQTIALAIAAASTNETTIKLLKDVATDITIPTDAKIIFDAAGITISKLITVEADGTLSLTNGTFTGAITNNGTLNLSGDVVLYVKPNAYTCSPVGYDLVVNAEGHYVVGDVANAEAQIGEEKYMTIADAFTIAGTNATTITLLKDPAEAITIPTGASITLVIQNVATTFEALTKAITVKDGTLSITSGTITGAITIANFNGKLKITDGVTHQAVVLSSELATDNVLKSKINTATPAVTSYWVEKKFEAKVSLPSDATNEQTSAATTLAANNTLSNVTGLGTNQSLIITVTGVTLSGTDVKAATFEVKLIGADGEPITTELSDAIGFNLPILYSTSSATWVNLWHSVTALRGTSTIQGTDDHKFIALSSTSFSPFSYEIIENPIAQIGETKYETVEAAIKKATATETEIGLLRDVDAQTVIDVPSGKNVKLTIGTHTVSGSITNGGTLTIWDGTNAEGTSGVISGAITNTGTFTISEKANISGAVSATGGTLTISGGTISNTITTSGASALAISNGSVSGAVSVGGSGTNQISGGSFSAAVNVTATETVAVALTISGGTFSNTITANGTDESHKGTINISGGTFTGTISEGTNGDVAISGGTHTNLPGKDLCATGYMPIPTDGKYTMTNEWTITDATVIDQTNNANFAYLTSTAGYTVKTAIYHRNTGMVSAGNTKTKYGTICLPFEIKTAPTGMTLYKATEINVTPSTNSGTLTITEVSYPVTAGTPLIFELTSAASTMTVTSTNDAGIAVNTTNPKAPTDGNLLRGTYSSTNITTGLTNIYYLNGDTFHQAVQSLKVPAFRAYMYYEAQGSAKLRAFSIVKEGEESTGISAVEALETVTGVYDLNGRKQNGLQRGINIMRRADGSTIKVIVK